MNSRRLLQTPYEREVFVTRPLQDWENSLIFNTIWNTIGAVLLVAFKSAFHLREISILLEQSSPTTFFKHDQFWLRSMVCLVEIICYMRIETPIFGNWMNRLLWHPDHIGKFLPPSRGWENDRATNLVFILIAVLRNGMWNHFAFRVTNYSSGEEIHLIGTSWTLVFKTKPGSKLLGLKQVSLDIVEL